MSEASSAYELAKAGGKHAGFLKERVTHPDAFLQRSLASIQQQIKQHNEWIANPSLKLGDLANYDLRQIDALVNKKWLGDIKRLQEQADILTSILNERARK